MSPSMSKAMRVPSGETSTFIHVPSLVRSGTFLRVSPVGASTFQLDCSALSLLSPVAVAGAWCWLAASDGEGWGGACSWA